MEHIADVAARVIDNMGKKILSASIHRRTLSGHEGVKVRYVDQYGVHRSAEIFDGDEEETRNRRFLRVRQAIFTAGRHEA
jgi:glutamate dehydrogenase/leucine dehydrogenase